MNGANQKKPKNIKPEHWSIGEPIASPVSQMVSLDPLVIGTTATYKLLIGAIVPRPIAFVSTLSAKGVGNLAPFSFFNGVSSNPAALMFAITRKKNGEKKDTLRNIEETGQFVVNTVSQWIAGPMNQCAAEYPYGVDEMAKVGLTPLASEKVAPPRVKESPIHFECEFIHNVQVGDGSEGSSNVIIGKIHLIHVFDQAYDAGKINLSAIDPIARLSGIQYAPVGEPFAIPRPQAK